MSRPNFFVGINELNKLINMQFDGEYDDVEFSMDVIEVPYLFIYMPTKDKWILKAMLRGDMYTHDETSGIERASLEVDKKSGEGTGQVSQDLSKHMGSFFHAAMNLSKYIQENHLEKEFKDLDPEIAGIYLKEKNGKLTYEVVEGRKRPDLMCQGLFGGNGMGRPYMDEFMERSENEDLSIEELTKKANEGNDDCIEKLALKYLNGDGDTAINPQKAAYWYEKLAESGDSNGMFNTGLFYAKSFGVERDFEKAYEWMKKAYDSGDGEAAALAAIYKTMSVNLKAAESGDPEAQAEVAKTYMSLAGSLEQAGTETDYKESVKWAEKAAAQGNGDGSFTLALAYEHGRGVSKNMKKAAELYQKGADAGNARCMNSLGAFYIRGNQVPKDEKKGFELIQQSADLGDAEAMVNLGRCYQFGTGTTGNMKKAVEWYEKSLKHRPDEELARKVQVFKTLADKDPGWDQDYDRADDHMPEGPYDATETIRKGLQKAGKASDNDSVGNLSLEEAYKAFADGMDEELLVEVPKTRFGRIKEAISSVRAMSYHPGNMADMDNLAPEIREQMAKAEEHARQFDYDEKTRTITVRNIELTRTSSKERVARIERLRKGDQLRLKADEDETIYTVVDKSGAEIGSLWVYAVMDPIIRNDDCEDIKITVDQVIPKSQRGKGAKKSVVKVTMKLKLKKADREGVKSVICFVGGDQTNTWYQKIDVVYSSLPVSVAERLFEIYNRNHKEYDPDSNDTGYIGLDNLADEVKEVRKKIRENMIHGLDYSVISDEDSYDEFPAVLSKAVKAEPDRYGILKEYYPGKISVNNYASFRDFLEETALDEETYCWINETHVSNDEYEASADGFNHWYDVVLLFKGNELPVDLNDEDVVSVFGTGKTVALADLSYGC